MLVVHDGAGQYRHAQKYTEVTADGKQEKAEIRKRYRIRQSTESDRIHRTDSQQDRERNQNYGTQFMDSGNRYDCTADKY